MTYRFFRNKRLFTIAFFMALAAMIMGIVNLTASNAVILTYSLISSATLSGLGFLWMPKLLAMCNFYMFLQEVCASHSQNMAQQDLYEIRLVVLLHSNSCSNISISTVQLRHAFAKSVCAEYISKWTCFPSY